METPIGMIELFLVLMCLAIWGIRQYIKEENEYKYEDENFWIKKEKK